MPAIVRRVLVSFAAISILVLLLGSAAWWSIHTTWFASLVRLRIVSVLQSATGGRVQIGSFSFDPDNLHARLTRLVIHGTEPAGAAPLLSVQSIDIGFRILSFFHRDVDLESISIQQPQVQVMVNADGTLNLPKPRNRDTNDPVKQLLDLRVKHLEVSRGSFTFNNKSVPLAFASKGLSLLLAYQDSGPNYAVSLDADTINLAFLKSKLLPIHINAKARLYADHADIESFDLVTGKNSSSIELSGRVDHFAHPLAKAKVRASLSIDELAKLADINDQLRNGRIETRGLADFSAESSQFNYNGSGEAHGAAFISPQFTLRGIEAAAGIVMNNDGMLLQHGTASARGAHFVGEGVIRGYRYLKVAGQVSHVELKEVGTYLTDRAFPWSGTGRGTAHASADLWATNPDFIIGGKIQIDAEAAGIPTSGNVEVTYYDKLTKVEFGDSALNLPHSAASFKGTLDSDFLLKGETADLADFEPLIPILGMHLSHADLPIFTKGGSGRFDGALHDVIHQPVVSAAISLNNFKFRNYDLTGLSGHFSLSADDFSVQQFQLQADGANATGNASAHLVKWMAREDSAAQLNARFTNLSVEKTAALFTNATLPVIEGFASGNVSLRGSVDHPQGNGSFRVNNLDAYGQQLNQVVFDADLDQNRLSVNRGRVQSGQATLNFTGTYQHSSATWSTGELTLKADTNGFPLSSVSTIRKFVPALNARAEVHLDLAGKILDSTFEPIRINGGADFQHVAVEGKELGSVSIASSTQGTAINFRYTGDLHDTKFHGAAEAKLTRGTPIQGDLQMDRISLATAKSLFSETKLGLPLDGFLDGGLTFNGSLEDPAMLHARATINTLQISSIPRSASLAANPVPDIVLRNNQPILIDVSDGELDISKFEIDGRDTSVNITGAVPFTGGKLVEVNAVGKVDMALFSLFDPNVRSSGNSELAANIKGSINSLNVTGALRISDGSFFLNDLPNGLSDVNGTVVFSRDRATIQKMTAHSGGGDISLGGSISFGSGNLLVYHLEAAARNVRVRYANSISVTANSDLRLSGTSASSVLSGMLTVTRVVFTPNADAGNLLAAASASGSVAADPNDFITGLHLDVGVESAPNLQVSTNLSRDVEAEIQLRLRGTPDHPIVLGTITANQGDIKIFGTRFTLNRGEVSFVNTVRVEPIVDLDLETQARGVTVDITVSGAPSKLNFNYRSDPPLQPRDIIALLTVGRAPDVGSTSNAQGGSDVSALKSGVNSVLGQAISPVSNRLSKLFGITNIKIDPFVQGITNTPQARLSVEQQISRDVTVTYITNLSQTSEQIFRFEWALNRQFSIVAIRDDNGEFGIDFQYKKRFK